MVYIDDNTTTSFVDGFADASLGADFSSAAAKKAAFRVRALTPGSGHNNTKARTSAGTTSGKYKLTVIEPYTGTIVEIWDNWMVDSTKTDHITSVIKNSQYIEIINASTSAVNPVLSSTSDVTDGYKLTGGTDGDTAPSATDYTGGADSTKGAQLLRNKAEVKINLLSIPGQSSGTVAREIIDIASSRGDCLAIVDPPQGYTHTQAISWHNDPDGNGSQALNSSYGATFWPWLGMNDPYSQTELAVPPSVFMGAVFAYNDFIAAPWFAAAGPNRGKIPNAVGLEKLASGVRRQSPNEGQITLLYSGGNSINAIVNVAGEGLMVDGNRTLLRTPKATDRINVRRLLAAIKIQFAKVIKFLQYDPADPITWRTYTRMADSILRPIKEKRGLRDYKIVCDRSTNTDDVINNNIVKGKIFLKPTKSAEIILTEFVIAEQGTDFTELFDIAA